MAKHIATVLSNLSYTVNYKDVAKFIPEAEIIILSYRPNHVYKDGKIKNELALEEHRFSTDLEGLNKLIGELQATANALNQYSQAGEAINGILEQLKKPKE